MRARPTGFLLILIVLIAAGCSNRPPADPDPASGTARLHGVVTFEGVPRPGARVTARHTQTNAEHVTATRADGTWEIQHIAPGQYVVHASSSDAEASRPATAVAGRSARADLTLSASIAEAITVTSAAPVAQDAAHAQRKESAVVSGVLGGYVTANAPAVVSPSFLPAPPSFNTEEYSAINESGFRVARLEPLSTFSIDVDTASYSNLRRMLMQGQLPPRDAVRIEEMLNYFTYDYPEPSNEPFSVTTELADCPWNTKHRLLQVGIQGRRIDTSDMPPNNLVFLLDVSGSMQSPDKLPLLVSSMRLLVDTMRPQDRVAIVTYAGAEGLLLPSTSGRDKGLILNALSSLEAGGSTAGAAGIRLAYKVAREQFDPRANNRVILATDGDFNVGVSSEAELQAMIERERNSGVFLSVLGFGTGNIKDNKMETLADRGNGNYAYIDSIREARKVLVEQMGGTLLTIAKDVKIQIEFNPEKVGAYRLIGYENRLLANEDFNDDLKDAGELGAGHSVTALYEIVPAGLESSVASVDALRYQKTAATNTAFGAELMQLKLRYKEPAGSRSRLISRTVLDRHQSVMAASANLRFAAAVAQAGMLLRDSEHRGQSSWASALALAQSARGADREGYRSEFLELVERARTLDRSDS